MLRGQDSISQYSRSNIAIWMTMAFQGGLINIGGFMACHRFVSHITGFASHFGFEMSQGNFSGATAALTVPGFFLVGSMISGQLVDVQLRSGHKPYYFMTFGIMFTLIAYVFVAGQWGTFGKFGANADWASDYGMLAVLCMVCGIQNAMVTSVSRAVVRTTHLTGITTDLGIGLVRVLNAPRLKLPLYDEVKANLMRLGIVFFFTLGSLIGAMVFRHNGYLGFALPLFTNGNLFLVTLYFHLIRQ